MTTPTTAITTTTLPKLKTFADMRQAQKQALTASTKSMILRITDGESVRIHFLKELTEGLFLNAHKTNERPWRALCAAEFGQDCEYCARAKAGEWKLGARLHAYLPVAAVVVEDGKKMVGFRIIDLGVGKKTVYATVEKFYDTNHTICSHDFSFSRVGNGETDTTYELTVELTASGFKPESIAKMKAAATLERMLGYVQEALPFAAISSGESESEGVVEGDLVESGDDGGIPPF